MLVVPMLCLAYAAWLVGSGGIIILPFLLPVMIWRARRAKRESTPLSIVPTNKAEVKELSDDAKCEIRLYFERLALSYAVILDRAGSESFLKTKVLPEGFVATTRRVHLDLLQQHGAWERMGAHDRMAMLAPDGHWEWPQVHEARRCLEPLRLLRWVLRADYFLPTLGQQLTWKYAVAHELVHEPGKLSKSSKVANRGGLETGRDAAQHLLYRCVAEQIHRGLWVPADAGATEWARGIVERLAGKQHEDFVLGTQLVGEVDDATLVWATRLSRQRMDFLTWVMSVLDGEPLPAMFPEVFLQAAEAVDVGETVEAGS